MPADPISQLRTLGFSDMAASLEDPSPQEWREVARELDGYAARAKSEDKLVAKGYEHVRELVRSALKAWPKELPRDPLPNWTNLQHADLLKLCLKVRETDTYDYYLSQIHKAPQLQHNGLPCVRLQRFFAGGAEVGKGDAWVKIGQAGQADLVGMMTLAGPKHTAEPSQIAVYTELEIKMPKGSQSEAQRVREQVIRGRGGIYLVAKSVRAAIEGLVRERARLQGLLAG